MVSVDIKGYLRELGGLHKTYYGMFRGRTEDPCREGSGWNKYGKMARREAGGVRHMRAGSRAQHSPEWALTRSLQSGLSSC